MGESLQSFCVRNKDIRKKLLKYKLSVFQREDEDDQLAGNPQKSPSGSDTLTRI